LHICIWGFYPILPWRFTQALLSYMGNGSEQQSSTLSTDFQCDSSLGFGWVSHSCSEAIRALLWLYAWRHCPVGMYTTFQKFGVTLKCPCLSIKITSNWSEIQCRHCSCCKWLLELEAADF
jgi:hypothetical protein